MQALRSLLCRYPYQRIRQGSGYDGLPAMNTFVGLPTEILLMIIDHLPIDDLACLSFCNHRLLGLSQWKMARLGCNKDEKMLILNRLEHVFPRYFACRFCNILHKYDGTESFGLSFQGFSLSRKYSIPCHSKFNSLYYSTILRTHRTETFACGWINFLHVKLAMKRFLYGAQCGIHLDSLRYTQVRSFEPNSLHSRMVSLFTREARICPNHLQLGLCVRLQDIMLVDEQQDFNPYSIMEGSEEPHPLMSWSAPSHILEVCRHIPFVKMIPGINKLLRDWRQNTFNPYDYKCEDCNTDSCMEVQRMDSKTALVITRWVALGQGISEEDPLWASHACGTSTSLTNIKVESPRMCFEKNSSGPFKFRDLMFRNLYTLRVEGYKKGSRFRRCASDFWFTPYEEPRKHSKQVRVFGTY